MGESRDLLLADLLVEARAYGAKKKLAQALGVTVQTIHNKLKKPQTISDPELVLAADTLGIDTSGHRDFVELVAGRMALTSDRSTTPARPLRIAEPAPPAEGFVMVPRYNVEASAGNGTLNGNEHVVDYMAFREDFVRRVLRAEPANLALITAVGDSMEPAIRAGDLLLIDRGVDRIMDDAIYVLGIGDELVVKRVQRFFDGGLTIKSDNATYREQTIASDDAPQLRVAGRVRWIGRLI